jgi:PAS domain S-box-containing protein
LGQEVVERFHPDFRANVKERIRLLNEEKKSVPLIEETCLKLDGTGVEAEVSAVPFTFNQQNGALVFLRDITARKRAEESVLSEKALSDTIINSLPGVFYCLDDQGRFLRWNRNFEHVSGYTDEEFAKLTALDMFEGEDRTRVEQAIREVFAEGQNTVEADLLVKDGGKAPYFFTGRRVDLGGIPSLIGMGVDFTERKTAERKIKLNEARMASLAKIAQYDSESIQDLLDFALDEAIAMTGSGIGYIYLYHDEKQQFILNTWSKEVMNECSVTEPQTIYHLEKTGIWGEAVRQARPIIVNDYQAPHPLKKGYPADHAALYKYLTIPVFSGERMVAVVGVANKEADYSSGDVRQLTLMMDAVWKIVDRQRAEEDLRRLNLELDQRVRERTAQLEAANRELESFTYSVSHDLRSPLRGIDGWSQALLEDYHASLGEEGRQFLNRVRWETQLIDDLLNLSRVGRAELRREPVDLSALVQGIAGKLRENEPERQVEFIIQPGLLVDGDPRLLEIALFKLLDNAWKFTGKRPEATIEFGADYQNGKPVFYVRDNGAGFDMAYAQKMFGAFQRLHKVSDFPGTGIGLATVQRIINRHGGRIWAEAAPERGATFFFRL